MVEAADAWALKWLDGRRAMGKKGLLVEKRSGTNQVRWQTTKWNPDTGKRDRTVVYLGVLDPPGHLVPSKGLDLRAVGPEILDAAGLELPDAPGSFVISDQRTAGTMRLLSAVSEDVRKALAKAFPKRIADDLMLLAAARLAGRGRLVRAGAWFVRQENCMCLNPHIDPEGLSLSLQTAGASSAAQTVFFEALPSGGRMMAADMTVCFSRSKGAFIVKRGYNRFKLTCGQFNIVLVCDIGDMMPLCMKTVAGNVRENSFKGMLAEYGLGTDVVLVMDRGYFDLELLDIISSEGYKFVVPVSRDSALYGKVPTGEGAFTFRDDAVVFGHGDGYGWTAYRYENLSSRNDELRKSIDDAGGMTLDPVSDRAGNLILVTNVNDTAENVYGMFKTRSAVERVFDTAKNVLTADSTYMRSTESIAGYNLVTFITLRMYMAIDSMLTAEGIDPKISVGDVLFTYGSATTSVSGGGDIIEYVPADLRALDSKLGLNLYP